MTRSDSAQGKFAAETAALEGDVWTYSKLLADAEAERDRYREALETLRDGCADWSNDDIRDQCREALDG